MDRWRGGGSKAIDHSLHACLSRFRLGLLVLRVSLLPLASVPQKTEGGNSLKPARFHAPVNWKRIGKNWKRIDTWPGATEWVAEKRHVGAGPGRTADMNRFFLFKFGICIFSRHFTRSYGLGIFEIIALLRTPVPSCF